MPGSEISGGDILDGAAGVMCVVAFSFGENSFDRGEFDAFALRASPSLLRSAYVLTGDRGHAEDLLQTTLWRTARRWRAARESPEAYAHRVLVNLSRDRRRGQRRRPQERAESELRSEAAGDPVERFIERDAMTQAVRRLPRRQREVVVLRFFLDLSITQTAVALGASEGTVKSHTARALARMRELLTRPTPSTETLHARYAMLSDEQLIEQIRSQLHAELAALDPPADFLTRLHQPARGHRPWSRRRRDQLPAAAARHWRIQSPGSVLAICAVGVSIALAVAAIVVIGHGRGLSTGATHGHGHGLATPHGPAIRPAAPTLQIMRQLNGIPQTGTQLGDPKAPVTMTIFADLESLASKNFVLQVFPKFIQQQVRTGKVKVRYRSLCTTTCNVAGGGRGEHVFTTQQVAAYAAGKQNLFWEYAELFYREQLAKRGYVTASYLSELAKQIPGLSLALWQANRSDPSLVAQVKADTAAATRGRITATPTLNIEGPKGTRRIIGVPTPSQLEHAIRRTQ